MNCTIMKKVFVNGYGSIGSRIAAFIQDDPQVKLVGIGKYSPDAGVAQAISNKLDVFVPTTRINQFGGYDITGTIESALGDCDLVVDASPGGTGYLNKKRVYDQHSHLKAIYQGGESIHGDTAVSDLLFNSRSNYNDSIGKQHVMQGSCNVTGMGRILEPLRDTFGDAIKRFDVTLIRRWADIEQTDKQIVDTIEITQSPHHGDDVKTYFGKDAPLFVRAVKVPTRQMHLHIMDIRFGGNNNDTVNIPKPSDIHTIFQNELGVAVLWTAKGTRDVREYANTMNFSFKDTGMIHIHANMTRTIGDTVQIMYSDDQTGIVIPENHMLMQALLFDRNYQDARAHTESLFHLREKKQMLESHFSK